MKSPVKKIMILCLLGLAAQSALGMQGAPSPSWLSKIGDLFWNRQNSSLTKSGKIALGTAAVGFGLWKLYKWLYPVRYWDIQNAYEAGDQALARRLTLNLDNPTDWDLHQTLDSAISNHNTDAIKFILRKFGTRFTQQKIGNLCIRAKTTNNDDLYDYCLNYLKENLLLLNDGRLAFGHLDYRRYPNQQPTWERIIAESIISSLHNYSDSANHSMREGLPSIAALDFMIKDENINRYTREHMNNGSNSRLPLHILIEHALQLPFTDNPYFVLIQWALDHGADPYKEEDGKRTAASYLTFHEKNLKTISHLRDLIFKNHEIDSKINKKDFFVLTGLDDPAYGIVSDYTYNDDQEILFAVYKNDAKKLAYLINEAGYNPNTHNDEQKSALMYAAQWGYENCAEVILSNTAVNIFAQNNNGMNALIFAAEAGHPEIVKLILEKAADKQKELVDTQTRSSYFAPKPRFKRILWRYRRISAVGEPQVAEAEIPDSDQFENYRDIPQSTAVMYAVRNCPDRAKEPERAAAYEAVVDLLLQHGADRNIVDETNKTALNYAEELQKDALAKMLKG